MGSDGSYFQCPHCRTRYAASARAIAADGKRIRCKQCEEPFTLTIVAGSRPPSQTQSSQPAAKKKVVPPPPQPKRVAAPKKKRAKRSFLQVGTLLVVLSVVVAGGIWWWLDQRDQSVVAVAQHDSPSKIDETKDVQDDDELPSAKEVKEMTQEVRPPDPSTLNFVVSPACRDVAAAQWLNDYTLTHTRFRQAEFVRLLDESVSLTAQVHKQCQNDQLLLSVVESAKQGKKPVWLAPLINALIDPQYDSTKVVGDEGF